MLKILIGLQYKNELHVTNICSSNADELRHKICFRINFLHIFRSTHARGAALKAFCFTRLQRNFITLLFPFTSSEKILIVTPSVLRLELFISGNEIFYQTGERNKSIQIVLFFDLSHAQK